MSEGNVQVGFFTGAALGSVPAIAGVVEITPPVANAIRAAGFDPSSFDTMRWPIGASRFGHGRYLIHGSTYDAVFSDNGSSSSSTRFAIGPLLLDRVYARGPQPIFISEFQGIVYAVDIVDERFFWSRQRIATARYNVSTDDRTSFYESSLNSGAEHTPRTALVEILDAIVSPTTEYSLPTGIAELDDADNLRDFDMSGQEAGAVVDAILAACGCVFIAYPSIGHSGFSVRYTVRTILSGATDASIFLDAYNVDHLGGGLVVPPRDVPDPASALSLAARGRPPMLDSEVPAAVEVEFPIAVEGGSGYAFNDPTETSTNRNFVTDRFYTVAPTPILPSEVGANGRTVTIHDGEWAIADTNGDITNAADLATRAATLSARYYDRFRAGIGNLLYRGILVFGQWSGALDVSFSVTSGGPFTRISGTFHDPRYGYSRKETLTADDVFAIGRVRPIVRPDGRILLDSPGGETSRFPANVFGVSYDPIERRDRFAYKEATIDPTTREWIDGGSNRDSIDGADLFAEPARYIPSYPTATERRGSVAWVREWSSDSGETFRFFEYSSPFAVTLAQVGGVVGDRDGPSTWTYRVSDMMANVLGDTAAAPIGPISRLANRGPLLPATLGLAFFDGEGVIKLLWTNEYLDAKGCAE